MQEQPQQSSERPGWSYIPNAAWVFVILVLGLFTGYSVFINWKSMPAVAQEIWTFILVVLVIVAIYRCVKLAQSLYFIYHDYSLKESTRKKVTLDLARAEEKLKQEVAKTTMYQQVPVLLKYAVDSGLNYKGYGVEITSPFSNVHTFADGKVAQGLLGTPEYVPEPYRLSDVLQSFTPRRDGILLGKNQEMLTVPVGEAMCHTALGGKTDSGKSNTQLLLMAQLLFLEECVYLCNPHYRRMWQSDTGEVFDLTALESFLAHEPITDPNMIASLLVHLKHELDDRKLKAKYQLARFDNIYLVMDELPAIAHYIPDIMDMLGVFLRESRKYGIFFVGSAQDFLNNTLESDNGAVRANFLTNYYGGGDDTTARILLDLAKGERIDQAGLGRKGLFYVLAKSLGTGKTKVRTPLVDTKAIEMLFSDRKPVHDFTNRMIVYGGDEGYTDTTNTVEASPVSHVTTRLITRPKKTTLDDAIVAWNAAVARGEKVGGRQLERDLHIPYHQANKYAKQIVEMERQKAG